MMMFNVGIAMVEMIVLRLSMSREDNIEHTNAKCAHFDIFNHTNIKCHLSTL